MFMSQSVSPDSNIAMWNQDVREKQCLPDEKHVSFSSLYCLKTLGAFFVICIHCFGRWQIYPIIRTAVPFFFMISGYFIFRKDVDTAIYKCTQTLKKVVWITIYANIFYYIALFLPSVFCPIQTVKGALNFILFGGSLSPHLWYLNAYIEALIVIIIALKFKVLKWLWCCIPIFVIWGLLTGKYEFLVPWLPNSGDLSRNFLTMGIPCFGIGWLLRQYESKILRVFRFPILLASVLLVLSECEILTLRHFDKMIDGDFLITTFPFAASLILVGIKHPFWGRNTLLEFIGKKYALDIYIFHFFILSVYSRSGVEALIGIPPFVRPFLIFFVTTIFIVIWRKCSLEFFRIK